MFFKIKLLFFKILSGVLLIVLATGVAFKYYEIRYFKPSIPLIEEVYNNAKREENYTEMVKNIVLCIETPYFYHDKNHPYDRIAGIVARHFAYKFIKYNNMGEWHFHGLLWKILLIHHFEREKLFILYLHFIPFEHGLGLANSAQYYFQKKISQLTVKEIVTLLGVARSPKTYSPFSNPKGAEDIQDILMEKLKKLNCLP
jgi:hypothetical protein